jgi:hypothetical protein
MVASMNMILAGVAIGFVIATIAWALYVLIRPATHVHYRHPADKLWRPLD